LIGLIYLRGLLKQNNDIRAHLYKDIIGNPLFGATMSRNRFSLLLSNLMFDEYEERLQLWPSDRFAAIRSIFENFNVNCLKYMVPSEYLTIDESLIPMRNQINFKQYNPMMPAKYGLLFKSLNDARYPYTYNSIVYSGKPVNGPGPFYIDSIENSIKKLVTNTSSKLPLAGRNISMDRLYTSIPIANWLREKSITVIDTLKHNRIGIPDELKDAKGREEHSVTLHYESTKKDIAICSYTVKTKSSGKKNVLMLTTTRPLLGKTKDDGKNKPALYKLYDFTKGGTDIVDQKIGTYTCKAKSSKWKMVAFYFMLDTARVNAQTIFSIKEGKNLKKTNSYNIMIDLIHKLVKPEIQRRSTTTLQKSILCKIRFFIDVNEDADNDENGREFFPRNSEKGKVCHECNKECYGADYTAKRKKLSRGKTQCQKCETPACSKHLVQVCKKHFS